MQTKDILCMVMNSALSALKDSIKITCLQPNFSGVGFFGVAHVMYIFAFGFRPLRLQIYIGLCAFGCLFYWYIYAGLTDSILKLSVLFYILVIVGMNWRALAKIR